MAGEAQSPWRLARRDVALLGEVLLVLLGTWFVLGAAWSEPLMRADGPQLWSPLHRSALAAGFDWNDHLYRFGVLGGSPMHVALGTTPLIQLSSLLGLSPTTAGNLEVIVIQLLVGYFGVKLVEAYLARWSDESRPLGLFERVVTIWLCSFGPALGWRIATGHENIMQGTLPWLAAIALWSCASTKRLSPTSLVVGWFAVFLGTSSVGTQITVYSAIFGAPITLVTVLSAPRGARFLRAHRAVVLALLAGIIASAPRLAAIAHHQLGDDVSRGVGQSLFYAYGHPFLVDFIESIPWTIWSAFYWPGATAPHETNYPIGPLILFALLLWPRGASKDLGLAWIAGLILATAFALDLEPVSTAIRRLPLVDSFRVPSRALLPLVVIAPAIAIAPLWNAMRVHSVASLPPLQTAVGLAAVVAFGFVVRGLPPMPGEILAWVTCGAIALLLRIRARPRREVFAILIALVAGFDLQAFQQRMDLERRSQRIEGGPQRLREHVLAHAPELAMPLARVQVPRRPQPFNKSTAFAAGLPTLDGVWYPTRRYLSLLGAVSGHPLQTTEIDFHVTDNPGFDVLTQLYNVRYVVEPNDALTRLPETNGAAWFPSELVVVGDASQVVADLRARGSDLRATIGHTAWLLRGDPIEGIHVDPACGGAHVDKVSTDALGQKAIIDVTAPTTCVLVVPTNYATMLRASAPSGSLRVVPVDIALTGIIVPPGSTRVSLSPHRFEPIWAHLAPPLVVILLLVAAWLIAPRIRTQRRADSSPKSDARE
jgi:hypothetical protein